MSDQPRKVEIDISWQVLFKVLVLALALFAAYVLRDLLIMLFIVFIFVAALNPTVRSLQVHMSRSLAVVLIYVVILGLLATLSYTFIPLVINQVSALINAAPGIIDKLRPYFGTLHSGQYGGFLDQTLNSVSSSFQSLSTDVLATTLGFFGGLATLLTGIILSFYVLLEEKNAREFFVQVLPPQQFRAVYTTLRKISEKMGSWVRGQLILMLLVGMANFIAYLAIGLPSPLPLAIWTGLCEIIPYLGPFLGMGPALLIAIASGNAFQALLVFVISLLLIPQLESSFIVPRVMSRAIGLSPVLVILALTVGFKLFGLVGAVIAIPAAAVISVIFGEWSHLRQIWESGGEIAEG